MNTSDNRILRTLRKMAWERAKGELQGLLNTYWDSEDYNDETYEEMNKLVDDFIKIVDEKELAS